MSLKVEIDGKEVQVADGATLLEACRAQDIDKIGRAHV
jgi:NADH dehydrogenase/NADH:ubiquinone oxidoreductase subunit G